MQNELEFAKPIFSRKTILIVSALFGLLLTAGFLYKSGKATAVVENVTAWNEERRATAEAEEAARIAQVNLAAAWRKKCDGLRSLPVDTRPPLEFRGAQKTIADVALRTDQWSRQITIPAGKYVSWQVSQGAGYYLVFGDGEIYEVSFPGPGRQYPNPGPMRFLAKSPEQTVSLEAHAPLATLNNSPR